MSCSRLEFFLVLLEFFLVLLEFFLVLLQFFLVLLEFFPLASRTLINFVSARSCAFSRAERLASGLSRWELPTTIPP